MLNYQRVLSLYMFPSPKSCLAKVWFSQLADMFEMVGECWTHDAERWGCNQSKQNNSPAKVHGFIEPTRRVVYQRLGFLSERWKHVRWVRYVLWWPTLWPSSQVRLSNNVSIHLGFHQPGLDILNFIVYDTRFLPRLIRGIPGIPQQPNNPQAIDPAWVVKTFFVGQFLRASHVLCMWVFRVTEFYPHFCWCHGPIPICFFLLRMCVFFCFPIRSSTH